ncbi:hypothetical protein HK100_005817 [Physocladia obscura]|uniref:Uncharacterized protein n=1 Tax=Physocladia obscura TaxID=109957 RepID=A0AAD5XID1_9FUNG|nr:hypothetical protein HK100_005817 [Physocladia obscura]
MMIDVLNDSPAFVLQLLVTQTHVLGNDIENGSNSDSFLDGRDDADNGNGNGYNNNETNDINWSGDQRSFSFSPAGTEAVLISLADHILSRIEGTLNKGKEAFDRRTLLSSSVTVARTLSMLADRILAPPYAPRRYLFDFDGNDSKKMKMDTDFPLATTARDFTDRRDALVHRLAAIASFLQTHINTGGDEIVSRWICPCAAPAKAAQLTRVTIEAARACYAHCLSSKQRQPLMTTTAPDADCDPELALQLDKMGTCEQVLMFVIAEYHAHVLDVAKSLHHGHHDGNQIHRNSEWMHENNGKSNDTNNVCFDSIKAWSDPYVRLFYSECFAEMQAKILDTIQDASLRDRRRTANRQIDAFLQIVEGKKDTPESMLAELRRLSRLMKLDYDVLTNAFSFIDTANE